MLEVTNIINLRANGFFTCPKPSYWKAKAKKHKACENSFPADLLKNNLIIVFIRCMGKRIHCYAIIRNGLCIFHVCVMTTLRINKVSLLITLM